MGKSRSDMSQAKHTAPPRKAAYVATVYSHLAAFHLPFMEDLRREGVEVHAYGHPDHRREKVTSEGFECRDIAFSRRPLSWGNVKALFQMIRWLRRERYDLIHVHTPNASLITRLAALLSGSRGVVYTAHGFHFHTGSSRLGWLIYYPLERFMSRFTDTLITINQEDYERASGFPVRNRVVYLPGVGVDISLLSPVANASEVELRNELGIRNPAASLVVLCVAELNRNKNQQQLIHAVYSLTQRGVPVVLLLAGVGTEEAEYIKLCQQLGVEDQVKFLGYRQDIQELMQAADVLALVSRREGLPKVLLEGLAAGKPILATDVRGSRDLVLHGDNGYVIPVDDSQAAAAALQELYDDPQLRRRMGERSRKMAPRYDLKLIRPMMREVYDELLANNRTRERGAARLR
ncbi:glycosyltransferase family 4 protein [Paenibacillus sp. YPG26]|uniref:glycosyltransferase family 4 protein n=1 Tax=Paenibacillus sp. YPG26 TaxID=2878915 RepID=UPI002041292C|nr:glycosyltransferase family 4 protein [Paenibacillus sp. YPG26]USB33024.1 glycosyltransferase family 4 protein [Paenibacillus sp. YPG26]